MTWTKNHKLEIAVIVAILLMAAFFRFYRISEYMTFLGDEGRDALVVKKILVDFDFSLLGPPTSVGNMYLGPLYYYMMSIPMSVFWLDPVSAVGMNALIGVLTVGLIFYLARNWFNFWGAITASFLYAISPVTILYSRSSWNPNPTPFFSLLIFFGLYKVQKSGNCLWFILVGVSLAFALQMHYLALMLVPIVGLLSAYEIFLSISGRLKRRYLLSGLILGLLAFLILMSPLMIFDLKYNFLNYRAFTNLISGENGAVDFNLLSIPKNVITTFSQKLTLRYLAGGNYYLSIFTSILIVIPLVLVILKKIKKDKLSWPFLTLGVWLGLGLLGLSFYHQEIYDHYLGFLNPVPYLLLAGLVSILGKKYQVLITMVLIVVLGFFNLLKNPLLDPPNRQLRRTQEIAGEIIKQSDNKPFNFALIAQRNYDSAYQFYLYRYGYQPKLLPFEKTDQLFVVCEDPICKPVGHPKHEIAAFGWAKIEKEDAVAGVKLYKLVPNAQDK